MNIIRRRSMFLFLVFVLLVGSNSGLFARGSTIYAAGGFAGGDGSPEHPYEIASAEQLDEVRNYMDSNFVLTADIDMSAYLASHPWVPIGSVMSPFLGVLDGKNHEISNVTIHDPLSSEPVGLFGAIGSDAEILHLAIDAVEVRGNDYVGILAGYNRGKITSVGVTGSVYGTEYIGGIIGRGDNTSIRNSYATGHVEGAEIVGGLIGYGESVLIVNGHSESSVVGLRAVGGLVGSGEHVTILKSYATGDVTGINEVGGLVGNGLSYVNILVSYAAGVIEGDSEVGGLVGIHQSGSEITQSEATGHVTGNTNVGGLVGMTSEDSDISGSHAAGNVNGTLSVGGLTGRTQESDITYSYATGIVNGINDVGGLSGRVGNGNVSLSYASGDVTGEVDVGGFIGVQGDAVISKSYALGNVVGCEDIGGFSGDNGNARISNSFATGTVTGSCAPGFQGDTVGGLVGDNSDGDIEFSYSIGRVIGDSLTGGLVGYSRIGHVTNSYYNQETAGQADAYGQGLTSDEMKDRQSYSGWDFGADWDIQAPHQFGYPYLREAQAFVTYAGNGTDDGSKPYSSLSYLPDSSVEIQEKSPDWIKTGYRFNGWNTEADGSGDRLRANDTVVLRDNMILYADWIQPAVPSLTTPVNGEYTNSSTPLITGSADAGETVVIILNESTVATVTAGSDDGSWSWSPTAELADGMHTVRAGIEDSAGHPVSLTAEHEFTVDTVAPVITLLGDASITLTEGASFADPGVTVTDAEEDIPVTITGGVDMEVPGTYTLQYDATDTAGNDAATVTRTIRIVERSSGRGGYQPSKNANLAQLTVKADKDELSLTPKFTSGTTHYEAETTADAITIEAIPSDANAVVFLDEAPHDKARTIALTVGDNEFEIKVRAESGTLKTYAVTIHRAATPLEPKPENPACTFRDIEGHWAEPIICEALNVGIVEGRSETTFQPEAYITRVEFAAILLRTLGINSRPAGDGLPFADQERIPSWATDVVSAAAENGVLQGYPDRTLQPLRHVNRSEMVAMIAKAMKWKLEPGDTSFEDDTDIPDWARGYVNGAVQRNLVHGRDGDRFSPMEPATRAEASALLLRLWHLLSPRSLT